MDSLREVLAANIVNGSHEQPAQNNGKIDTEESNMALKTFERDHIMKALSENNWHRRRTAEALGINRKKTLFRKMQRFGMTQH